MSDSLKVGDYVKYMYHNSTCNGAGKFSGIRRVIGIIDDNYVEINGFSEFHVLHLKKVSALKEELKYVIENQENV